MKKITVFMFTAFFLAGVLIMIPQGPAHAQDPVCMDAAGGVIPCPPTAEIPCGQPGGPACPPASNEDDNGVNNQNPPSVSVTSTPLPITNPAESSELAGVTWSGDCKNAGPINDPCALKLMDSCHDSGGSSVVDLPDKDGTVTVTCTLPLIIEPTPLPLANPTDEGTTSTEPNETRTTCSSGKNQHACVLAATNNCPHNSYPHGVVSQETGTDGSITVVCTMQIIEPTSLPLSAIDPTGRVDGEWHGGCNFGDNYDFCMEDYKASCNNEGGVYSETHDDDGSNVSCTDTTQGRPNGGFPGSFPWLGGGFVGILAALSVQGVRKYMANANNNDEAMQLRPKRTEISSNNKPDDSEEFHRLLGDSDGDTPPPPPKK